MPPRQLSFDIYGFKDAGIDKAKEEKLLRKEAESKFFTYRKVRALYGTRPSGALLKGTLDSADDS